MINRLIVTINSA